MQCHIVKTFTANMHIDRGTEPGHDGVISTRPEYPASFGPIPINDTAHVGHPIAKKMILPQLESDPHARPFSRFIPWVSGV